MNYKEIYTETSDIKELKAYNNFWNLIYETTVLTEQEKDRLVSIIMKQYPAMSLITAETYLADLIIKYIENRSKQ